MKEYFYCGILHQQTKNSSLSLLEIFGVKAEPQKLKLDKQKAELALNHPAVLKVVQEKVFTT